MKHHDIHKVLIIGSGPIVVGQACEFDYSGTQACKALRELGYKIVLVNSNPATIMTDPVMADATYIEPLNVARLSQIIEKERPDALLPNLGGQTGLNLSSELHKAGILEKYAVKVIGVSLDAIERGEDRQLFKDTMAKLGIAVPLSDIAYSVEQAERIAADLSYPVVVRPAYTLGGAGGGLVYNVEELRTVAQRGLELSLTRQCLIEESILGWEELEVEVLRDAKNQMIAVCFIENIDAVGVHTGDSFCAAPFLSISPELRQRLQDEAFRIVESIGVIGGTNVQFAHDPNTGRVLIIEINPRTSRSSALASKATGFPIAFISAKLAAGLTLDEITDWRGGSLVNYRPQDDYIVVKFARWAFEKFRGVEDKLGTQMKAVGEVMSIGKTFKESFQKAIRSLENGRYGLGFAKDFHKKNLTELMDLLIYPSSERYFIIYEALRKGADIQKIAELSHIKSFYLSQMKELVDLEEELLKNPGRLPTDQLLIRAKHDGFADKYLAKLLGIREKAIRQRRTEIGLLEGWQAIAVSGRDNSFYYYSSYNAPDTIKASANPKKVMILGGGPNRIGQGIEFDYCCVHAALALRELGYESIMVNCNPETVSTDYDCSDKLYFEPVTAEDVLQIYAKERPLGVIVQFGGQTPLNIARELADEGVRILGTSIDSIDIAEDRDLFRKLMDKLAIPMPDSEMASDIDEAVKAAIKIGYPIMIRPSFVLGGRGMEVVYDEAMLREYVAKAVGVTPDRPLLLDRFLQHALECEADALSDGEEVFIPAVMEHIELAGVHSGDSASILPAVSIGQSQMASIQLYTRQIAESLGVCGLLNIQYAIEDSKVYVLEANPRASRTVPLVSKVCKVQLVRLATQLMLGEKLTSLKLLNQEIPFFGAKEAVFPFDKFPEVDPVLGPEMRSTGEVLSLADNYALAFYKSQEAAGSFLPAELDPASPEAKVLVSLSEKSAPEAIAVGRAFKELGFTILATEGTAAFYRAAGIDCQTVHKLNEGRPNVLDLILNRQVRLVINTPTGRRDALADDAVIRKAVIKYKLPYITTLAAALAAAQGIRAARAGKGGVRSLQDYHAGIS